MVVEIYQEYGMPKSIKILMFSLLVAVCVEASVAIFSLIQLALYIQRPQSVKMDQVQATALEQNHISYEPGK